MIINKFDCMLDFDDIPQYNTLQYFVDDLVHHIQSACL